MYCSTGLELSFEFSTTIEFSTEIEFSAKINSVGPRHPRISAVRFIYPPQIIVSATVVVPEMVDATKHTPAHSARLFWTNLAKETLSNLEEVRFIKLYTRYVRNLEKVIWKIW